MAGVTTYVAGIVKKNFRPRYTRTLLNLSHIRLHKVNVDISTDRRRGGILGHQFKKDSSLLLHAIHSLSTGGFLHSMKSAKQEKFSLNEGRKPD
jgi:hypothetical protein